MGGWQDRVVLGGAGLPEGFTHLPYVNPDAPRGGTRRITFAAAFDTLNPFTLIGRSPILLYPTGGSDLLFEPLFAPNQDEPTSVYAHLAAAMRVEGRRVTFRLEPAARWHDDVRVSVEDLAFSVDALQRHGRPYFRTLLRGVRVVILAPDMALLELPMEASPRMALELSGLPMLPAHWWRTRDFSRPLTEPPLGSGPYRLARVEMGRSLRLERVADWWGEARPMTRGRHNFEVVEALRISDSTAAFEAVMAGQLDEVAETDAGRWASAADLAPVRDGRVVRARLRNWWVSGTSGVLFNLRHPAFADPRMREALNLLFDFTWANRVLLRGEAARDTGYFNNSPLGARGMPDAGERALLPADLHGPMTEPHAGDGTGRDRAARLRALALMREAGWDLSGGVMRRGTDGVPLRFTVLAQSERPHRLFGHWFANLARLGIEARLQVLDTPSFERRRADRQFDALVLFLIPPAWPGTEQRRNWGSSALNPAGNLVGLESAAADAAILAIERARDWDSLRTATRALDRVVARERLSVPGVHETHGRLYLSARIARPERQPEFGAGRDAWWSAPA